MHLKTLNCIHVHTYAYMHVYKCLEVNVDIGVRTCETKTYTITTHKSERISCRTKIGVIVIICICMYMYMIWDVARSALLSCFNTFLLVLCCSGYDVEHRRSIRSGTASRGQVSICHISGRVSVLDGLVHEPVQRSCGCFGIYKCIYIYMYMWCLIFGKGCGSNEFQTDEQAAKTKAIIPVRL